ncbi:MAG: hypothetical protein ACRDP8_02625 [Actinopolymorphaceae bacterium]
MPRSRNDTTYDSTPPAHDYAFFPDDSEYQRDPVFVDSSGRRARVARVVKFGITGLCALYTTVLGLSLAGATAIAPSTLLPLPGVPSSSFRIEPADEPDEPEAAERREKAVASDKPGTTGQEAASWEPSLGAGPVATPSASVSPARSAPTPTPPPGKGPVKPPSQPQEPQNPPGSGPEPEPSTPATTEPTATPAATPEPTTSETPAPTDPPETDPDDPGGEGGSDDGGTSDLPILGDVLDILTTCSVPSFAAGFTGAGFTGAGFTGAGFTGDGFAVDGSVVDGSVVDGRAG